MGFTVALGGVALVGLHAIFAIGSRYFGMLFLMCATYLGIFLCGGVSKDSSLSVMMGYFSIYLLMVMLGTGILKLQTNLLKGCSGAMILFYLLLIIRVFFSNDPLFAFKWNMLGLITLGAGVSLAKTVKTLNHFRRDMRLLLIPLCIGAVLLLHAVIVSGGTSRLDLFGNPNATGIIASSAFCISAYLAIWDLSKIVRSLAVIVSVVFAIAVIATGSRACMGASVVVALILTAPRLKHPGWLLGESLLVLVVLWFLIGKVDIHSGISRAVEWDMETGRKAMWADKMTSNEDWLFGNGTVIETSKVLNEKKQWANMHSMYVQLFYEHGVFGLSVFVLFLLYAIRSSFKLFFSCPFPEKWLAYALIALPMTIGFAESAPLMGLSILTLWWGMGLGLLDRCAFFWGATNSEKFRVSNHYMIQRALRQRIVRRIVAWSADGTFYPAKFFDFRMIR